MKHNKNYFIFYNVINSTVTVDSVAINRPNFSLRYILGQLYDKYNAFSIKLEGYVSRQAGYSAVVDDYLLLHIEGLPWMSGYDTSEKYCNSRVLEMIDYSNTAGYNFISGCNGLNFWKPSTEKVDLKLFHTRISDETLLPYNDDATYIFSITGLDNYKVLSPIRGYFNIERQQRMNTKTFVLESYKGTSIDSRKRAFKFSGVNLRNIIGQDFDKYKKFALITKSYVTVESDGNNYSQTFSGNLLSNIMISGFSWYRPSSAQYTYYGTTAQQQEIANIHPTPACIVCQVPFQSGGISVKTYKETYIENVFEKSQEIIDIIISNTNQYGYYLSPVNTSNIQNFPDYCIQFDIIPIEEY